MSATSSYVNEIDEITTVMQAYIDGARTGKGAAMKPAFHNDATIFGYVGPDLFSGAIQGLYDWNDQNGPAPGIQSRFTSVDVVGTVANVRVDTDNWTGHRFTDFFNLVKIEGQWKIVSKVFYLHP
jgi:Putative lumazine-binding